jgi:hypothetical protein
MSYASSILASKYQPAAHSQYEECEYFGGKRMAMIGMAKHGTNCTSAYGRRSFAKLHHKHANIVFSAGVHT